MYSLKKILKNALLAFFACWLIYFIYTELEGHIALAAVRLSPVENLSADGEVIHGHEDEIRKWISSFKDAVTYHDDPMTMRITAHMASWYTESGRVEIWQTGKYVDFIYSVKEGDENYRVVFWGIGRGDPFPLCQGGDLCDEWEKILEELKAAS